jgi:hypothetical protein
MINFKEIDTRLKHKFINLCLILFPEYKKGRLKNNGTIVFYRKNCLFSRETRNFYDIVINNIPAQVSYIKWKSNGLTKTYLVKIGEILNSNISSNLKLLDIIGYFTYQIENQELYDFYNNCNPFKILVDTSNAIEEKASFIKKNTDFIDNYTTSLYIAGKEGTVRVIKETIPTLFRKSKYIAAALLLNLVFLTKINSRNTINHMNEHLFSSIITSNYYEMPINTTGLLPIYYIIGNNSS